MKIWRPKRGPTRSRSTDASDDHGSMPMALLVTLVGMSLSAVLVPVVVNQILSTRTVSARTYALDAALAGIDAAVGQLRAATATATPGVGKLDKLPPCAMTGSQAVGGLHYRVTMVYDIPDDAGGTKPSTTCPPTSVPVTAKLTSTGSGSPGSLVVGGPQTRTIEATYNFNNAASTIQLDVSRPVNQLCIDGGAAASPAAGAPVYAELCTGIGGHQRFSYTRFRNIKLVGSEAAAAPAGMCLEAPLPDTTPDDGVTFQPCQGRVTRQQWRLNESSNFYGSYDGATPDDYYCLQAKNAGVPGSTVNVVSCKSPVLQQWRVSANFAEPPALTTIRER